MKKSQISKIAILEFSADKFLDKADTKLIQDRMITAFVQGDKVEVIDRTIIDQILAEKNLLQTGVLDEKTAKEIGAVLGVEALVTGSVTTIRENRLEINARVVSVKNAKILAAASVNIENPRMLSIENPVELIRSGPKLGKPFVQLALLLDTSNSMDGLILQAKTRLWRIVNELASAERKGANPEIEVALYEYGNDSIPAGENYLKQVMPFTKDLDKISEKLFALKTNGGEEYAGAVIGNAVMNLQWKPESDVYKAIFIAGNEPFTQGQIPYQDSITKASKKGIIVNTIFCGTSSEGKSTGWSDGALWGHGEFLNIDPDTKIVHIKTPYDADIERYGIDINRTFVPYGESGKNSYMRQAGEDKKAESEKASGSSIQRSMYKGQKQYSSSATWDLITLIEQGKLQYNEIKKADLPAELGNLSNEELKLYIEKKITERKKIQNEIASLAEKRKTYLKDKEMEIAEKNKNSLDETMMKSIKRQASELEYKFK